MIIKQIARPSFSKRLSVVYLAVVFSTSAYATREYRYRTEIVDVVDGGTIVVSNRVFTSGYEIRISNLVPLDGIDAPPLDEQGGRDARDNLLEWVLGKQVNVCELIDNGISKGVSLYLTNNARKFDDEDNINLKLLRNGLAKWKGRMMTASISVEKMLAAQHSAQEKKLGVWEWMRQEDAETDKSTGVDKREGSLLNDNVPVSPGNSADLEDRLEEESKPARKRVSWHLSVFSVILLVGVILILRLKSR